jgi:hypothetical protein
MNYFRDSVLQCEMKSEVSRDLEIKRWLINGFGCNAAKGRVQTGFRR